MYLLMILLLFFDLNGRKFGAKIFTPKFVVGGLVGGVCLLQSQAFFMKNHH